MQQQEEHIFYGFSVMVPCCCCCLFSLFCIFYSVQFPFQWPATFAYICLVLYMHVWSRQGDSARGVDRLAKNCPKYTAHIDPSHCQFVVRQLRQLLKKTLRELRKNTQINVIKPYFVTKTSYFNESVMSIRP